MIGGIKIIKILIGRYFSITKVICFLLVDFFYFRECLFVFEGLITKYSLPVSGTFDMLEGEVTEVIWELNGEARTMPDLGLDQLEGAIEATYEALALVE